MKIPLVEPVEKKAITLYTYTITFTVTSDYSNTKDVHRDLEEEIRSLYGSCKNLKVRKIV